MVWKWGKESKESCASQLPGQRAQGEISKVPQITGEDKAARPVCSACSQLSHQNWKGGELPILFRLKYFRAITHLSAPCMCTPAQWRQLLLYLWTIQRTEQHLAQTRWLNALQKEPKPHCQCIFSLLTRCLMFTIQGIWGLGFALTSPGLMAGLKLNTRSDALAQQRQ